MTWALEQQRVTDAPARHVLLCLANYAGPDGCGAFPSTATLARDTGLSERTVRAKLDALQAMGLIRPGNAAIVAAYIDRADRRPSCYDLLIGVQQMHPAGGTGCSSRTNGVQLTTPRGAGAAPNPSINQELDPELARAGEACLLMRRSGCLQTNPSHPDLIAALAEGVTPQALADTAAEAIGLNKPRPFTWAIAAARGRHAEGARPITGGNDRAASDQRHRGESLADRAARRLKQIADAHPEAFEPDAAGEALDAGDGGMGAPLGECAR